MKRCTKCILPENYSGISFNDKGVCNYCMTWKDREYLGSKILKKNIDTYLKNNKDRNKNYDCVLGLS